MPACFQDIQKEGALADLQSPRPAGKLRGDRPTGNTNTSRDNPASECGAQNAGTPGLLKAKKASETPDFRNH